MGGWEYVIYAIILILAYVAAPKPQSQPPASMQEEDVPIAEEGVEIPVLFGTRDIGGPNVVWYGDIRTSPVKSGGGKK